MEETITEINLGAEICRRLKNIYYPDTEWIKCYKLVAIQFSSIKKTVKLLFPDLEIIDLIKKLNQADDDYLKDCLEHVDVYI